MKQESDYRKNDIITVSDSMQQDYTYILSESPGDNFDMEFSPELSPRQMLKMGIFEGKYLNDCKSELPSDWFKESENSRSEKANTEKNYFKIKSRQSLSIWTQKRWIAEGDPDPRGWFQWYCRYYLGRRDEYNDMRQIRRWRAFKRHKGQILKNCSPGDLLCRPKQRQALLQWAYDPLF